MKKDLSFLVEYARVHVSCVKVDAAVVLVVRIVESHRALSFGVVQSSPAYSRSWAYAGGGLYENQRDRADERRTAI